MNARANRVPFGYRRMSFVLAVFLSVVPAVPAKSDSVDKAKLLVITTGGTIAGHSRAGMQKGADLVKAVPALTEIADIEVEEFTRVGSSKITPKNWLDLANRINLRFSSDPDLSGIVVTHGTDTMEETAYFLHLTVKSSKPVVLVGAMRARDETSADGPANLEQAVRVAVNRDAAGHGVMIVLNEDIHSARDAWKTNNRRVHAFQSPNTGVLGVADPDAVRFYRRPLLAHTTQTEFDVADIDSLAKVAIISDYTGFDANLNELVRQYGADGVVIRTFPGARMSAGMMSSARRLLRSGIPIVITSRVPTGRVVAADLSGSGAVLARDLHDNKARILLMLALTKTKDPLELQRIFDTY